jgi:hypothetical protein
MMLKNPANGKTPDPIQKRIRYLAVVYTTPQFKGPSGSCIHKKSHLIDGFNVIVMFG